MVDINTAAANPLIPKPTNFTGIGSLQGGLNQQVMGEAQASLDTELVESAKSERNLQTAKDELAVQRGILQQKIDEKNRLQAEKTSLQGQVTSLEANLATANQQLASAQQAFEASEQRKRDAEAAAARARATVTPSYAPPVYSPPVPEPVSAPVYVTPGVTRQMGVEAQRMAAPPPTPPPIAPPPPAAAPIVPMRFGVSEAFQPKAAAPVAPVAPYQNASKDTMGVKGVTF